MDTIINSKIYSVYAPFYDYLFGGALVDGRYKAVELMDLQPGEEVLEVGVGTGISLPLYPSHSRVVGIDMSGEMLGKAKEKKVLKRLSNVSLYRMDAERMGFADGRFDKVIASHVITVVPNPVEAVMEMKRVCKMGGEVFILNYFGNSNGILSLFGRTVSSVRKKLGFGRPLNPEKILEGANLKIVETHRVNFLKLFHLIRCKNEG